MLVVAMATPAHAAGSRAEFDARVRTTVDRITRDTVLDTESTRIFAGLLQTEYGTSIDDLKWAVEHAVPWGDVAALAYIRATTGRSFEEINSQNAQRDLWSYIEQAGMNSDKLLSSLERIAKLAEMERNSRIFDRLRGSRIVSRLPDLGSGFGLVQDAMDFRHVNTPNPEKIHTVGPQLAKGDQ